MSWTVSLCIALLRSCRSRTLELSFLVSGAGAYTVQRVLPCLAERNYARSLKKYPSRCSFGVQGSVVSPLWPTKNLFPNVSELVSYVIISPNFALCFLDT